MMQIIVNALRMFGPLNIDQIRDKAKSHGVPSQSLSQIETDVVELLRRGAIKKASGFETPTYKL